MDDLALLDLLECPVCFEKLDATAKVLPCQHTFCKPCLQRILKSQKELRCPECRTLVLGSIEQLPSNLLLIRLLDGVRCGQNVSRFGSMQRSGVLSSPASLRRVPRGLQLHQHRLATNPRMHMEGVPRARALYTYRGHSPGELRFNKGDTIVLLRQLDEHWYLGELNGSSGAFPASSVQVIQHLPLALPRPLCSLHLRARDKGDAKDILSFQKQSSPAQQLLQATKGHWSPQPKGTSLGAASAKAKGAGAAPFPKVPEPRRKSLRQFSITTALNTLNRMVHAPAERPALHISSPVLISSSNPSVPAPGGDRAELPCGTPAQVSTSHYPTPGALGPPAIVTLPHLQHHGPAYLCVALHSYAAHGPDELELQKGEGVRVFGKDQDGWLRGMSLVTGRVGLFPSNYVAPLFRKSSLSDSKMPSLYTSWTLSSSSLSSQGSVSERGPRQSRALRSLPLPVPVPVSVPVSVPVPVPVPVPCPGRAPPAPAPLRRGRGSARKNGSLQRPGQAGTPVPVTGSLRRPSAAGRPQHFQLYPHGSSGPLSIAAGAALDEPRPSGSSEAAPALPLRAGESRSPSVCSSVILDPKEPPGKSEAAPKPPASAPPSILVKPETSRNSAEKQVKTVRFQNHSPPPPKRHSLQPSPRLVRSRTEPEGLLAEPRLGPELLVLYSPRLGSSPLHPRRALHPKALSLDLSGQLTFPIKKSYSSISAN
ncbi:PREDICTED: putative E3 ubiquitin-protein ligase SH3RF2 [Sturnus vulgaris]|uniref:putative E3 ubiquitin-protein ligase SH3RF2 n=1 Tax=Sturnus vulgaris TaxID=9172 RepID=UPI000719F250|nr:PREDICTED: putative E3 ubiquitin-protein ligase SH3RF2 [Sturnus vulgaris]